MKTIAIHHPESHILDVNCELTISQKSEGVYKVSIFSQYENQKESFWFDTTDLIRVFDVMTDWKECGYDDKEDAIRWEFCAEIENEIRQWAISIFDEPSCYEPPMSDYDFYKAKF